MKTNWDENSVILWGQIWMQTGGRVYWQTWDQIRNQVGDRIFWQVWFFQEKE